MQVAERTQELERANQRLGQLAVTDELTGAFNRRRFNETCAALVARKPPRAPITLCMFDLDHFKRYNDHYGHQAGDTALRKVVQVVDQARHGQGELFRLGGEEFGILFSASRADEAHGFVDRLRAAIEAMQILHESTDAGIVTASFGVLWCGCSGPGLPSAAQHGPTPRTTADPRCRACQSIGAPRSIQNGHAGVRVMATGCCRSPRRWWRCTTTRQAPSHSVSPTS